MYAGLRPLLSGEDESTSALSRRHAVVEPMLGLFLVAGGKLGNGRHVKYSRNTPITNLHLSLLDLAGVPVDRFGDATGRLDYLSGLTGGG